MAETKQTDQDACRPRRYVLEYGRKYPEAWRRADKMRMEFADELPGWSYLPDRFGLYVLAPVAVKSGRQLRDVSEEIKGDATAISTLLTWRMTQGIYSFDPDVYEAVCSTPLKGDIPPNGRGGRHQAGCKRQLPKGKADPFGGRGIGSGLTRGSPATVSHTFFMPVSPAPRYIA